MCFHMQMHSCFLDPACRRCWQGLTPGLPSMRACFDRCTHRCLLCQVHPQVPEGKCVPALTDTPTGARGGAEGPLFEKHAMMLAYRHAQAARPKVRLPFAAAGAAAAAAAAGLSPTMFCAARHGKVLAWACPCCLDVPALEVAVCATKMSCEGWMPVPIEYDIQWDVTTGRRLGPSKSGQQTNTCGTVLILCGKLH